MTHHAHPHPAGAAKEKCCHGTSRRTLLRALPLVSLAPLIGGGSLTWLAGCEKDGRSFTVRGGEMRPVVNPMRYRDPKVRMIYAMAQDNRELLDKLYCYCYCDREPFNHKSLLSCYTNDHGAG